MGVVSGMSIPLLAVFVLVVITLFPSGLPYIMGLAGGAIIYTVIEEIPVMISKENNDSGAFAFVIGFAVIMLLIFK